MSVLGLGLILRLALGAVPVPDDDSSHPGYYPSNRFIQHRYSMHRHYGRDFEYRYGREFFNDFEVPISIDEPSFEITSDPSFEGCFDPR